MMSKYDEDEFEFDEELDYEMSPEDIEEALEAIENFQEKYFQLLAGGPNYELVPTVDNMGKPLTKEHYGLVKRECQRLGAKILYVIDQGKDTLIINPVNLKMGFLNDEVH